MKVSNEGKYDVYTCALWNTIRWYYVFFIKIVHCRGSGFELLSAFLPLASCHDSSVRRLRKFPVSMIFALSKSITWSLSHACFAMFEPLLCFLTFLMCSAFLVFRDLPVSPKYRQIFENKKCKWSRISNSGYLVVIQPQSVQQQSITYIYTNRWYYSSTDLYIYTSCSAVALIVVELRPGSHYCHAHMHLYIGCCY